MKTIHTYRNYSADDDTATGLRLELRDNGSIKITSHSRWQGSRSGRVILTAPGTISLPLPGDDDTPDGDAVLAAWLDTQCEYGSEPSGRLLRVGYIVK